jgi:hypothetical protein
MGMTGEAGETLHKLKVQIIKQCPRTPGKEDAEQKRGISHTQGM